MRLRKNKIAEQSRKWIIESFFDLLHIKNLSKISVTEIVENAELDRRTFYRHFKSKEDIISFYIHEASKQYENIMKTEAVFDNRSIAGAFFNICDNHKDILKLLYKQNLLHLLLNDLNEIFQKYQYKFASAYRDEASLFSHQCMVQVPQIRMAVVCSEKDMSVCPYDMDMQ